MRCWPVAVLSLRIGHGGGGGRGVRPRQSNTSHVECQCFAHQISCVFASLLRMEIDIVSSFRIRLSAVLSALAPGSVHLIFIFFGNRSETKHGRRRSSLRSY